jgi:ribonuclease BN (tRNA processing enzyme)
VLVDCGGTTLKNLKVQGRDPNDIDLLLITHLHGDHFGGFPFLYLEQMFLGRRDRDFHVLGPPHVQERLEGVVDLFYGASIAEHANFEIRWQEIRPGETAEVIGVTVEAFAANHLEPPEQALCLRVTGRDGTRIAFSGDTEPCEGLREAADGADLLVAECSGMRPPCGPHCTWEDWKDLLPGLGAKRVMLTHLGADSRSELPGVLESGTPDGPPVLLAEDGLVVEAADGATSTAGS